METIPELTEYEKYKEGLAKAFTYGREKMNLTIPQSFYYAEEHAIDHIYKPFERYTIQNIGLLAFGIDQGYMVTRESADGEYLFDELSRKYKNCKSNLEGMINEAGCSQLKSDYQLVLEKYRNELE